MQALALKIQKRNTRACPKCGEIVKPRPITGRYYCPNHPEGDAEFIITKEYFADILQSNPSNKITEIVTSFEVRKNRFPSQIKKWGAWKCYECGRDITEKNVAIFYFTDDPKPHYLHIFCAQGIGLKLESVQ